MGDFTPCLRTTDAAGKRGRRRWSQLKATSPQSSTGTYSSALRAASVLGAARGRNATRELASIFAGGVLRCSRCGGVVTRMSKGKYVYLVCSRANRKGTGACKFQTVSYANVEEAVVGNAIPIAHDAPRGKGTKQIEADIAALVDDVDALEQIASVVADELVQRRSTALREKLDNAEAELESARERLRALRMRRDAIGGPYVRERIIEMRRALRERPLNVARANKAMKEALNKIVLDTEASTLAFHWHHAPDSPTEDVPFTSRHANPFKD